MSSTYAVPQGSLEIAREGVNEKVDKDPPVPGICTLFWNNKYVLFTLGFASYYSSAVALATWDNIMSNDSPFTKVVNCRIGDGRTSDSLEAGICPEQLLIPVLNEYPKQRDQLKAWDKKKPSGDDWYLSYYFGISSVRACTHIADADEWSKTVTGEPYEDMRSYDGFYSQFDACTNLSLHSSCNIDCGGSSDCATSCEELLSPKTYGNTTNGWLWKCKAELFFCLL
jgi:hypothetical protein